MRSRIPALKPRLVELDTRRFQESQRIGSTPRTRGDTWMKIRAKWLRQHPLCCMCEAEGRVSVADEVDHITPLWAGGSDDESNFQSLCKPHHAAKTADEARERAKG